MKKLGIVVVFLFAINCTFANGLLTNTNQSAQFIRMMSRNASLGIDGVYYNPAGLIKLEDGWHFSVSSQTIFQKRTIESKFPGLNNNGYYEGDVNIPTFPTGFAVYKVDKWALSVGFGPNAGGGTAMYERGLPSFEIPMAKIVPALRGLADIDPSLSISGYDANLTFDGSSVFLGFQFGATYEVNEMLSGYLGARYISAKNDYQGSIRDVKLKAGNDFHNAPEWLSGASSTVAFYGGVASTAAAQVQPIIDQGGGSFTLSQLLGAGMISEAQKAQLEGGLTLLGLSGEAIAAMDVSTVQNTYSGAAAELNGTAASLAETGQRLVDSEVDTKQTGSFFTPIIGVNISPNEFLNIGLKYEHKTYLSVTNNTTTDDLGLFPDGDKSGADIPGFIGVGIGVTDNYWFEAQLSANYYLDQTVGWGGNIRNGEVSEIDKNSFDVALGVQLNATDVFSLSGGVMYEKAGLGPNFNSDFRFATPSYVAFGGGIMWKVTEQLTLDAGVSYIVYEDAEERFTDPDLGIQYNETYDKESMSFAIGLSYTIPY